MAALRRLATTGLCVVLALMLAVLTFAFALRWVDVATREVAALQAVLPLSGAGIVAVTIVALVCRFWRLLLAGALVSVAVAALAVAALLPASVGHTGGATGDGALVEPGVRRGGRRAAGRRGPLPAR